MTDRLENTPGRVLHLNNGEGGSFWSAFWTIVIISVCLLVTGAVAVRTDFVRQWIEESLSEKYDSEISIEKTAIVWPYVLTLNNVSTSGDRPEGPGLVASEIRIPLHQFRRKAISVSRATVRFRRDAGGTWEPARLVTLAGIEKETDITRVTQGLREKTILRIMQSDFIWENTSGEVEKTAEGVNFVMESHDLDGHKVYYYSLEAARITREGTVDKVQLKQYWLATDANPHIELTFSVDAPAAEENQNEDASE